MSSQSGHHRHGRSYCKSLLSLILQTTKSPQKPENAAHEKNPCIASSSSSPPSSPSKTSSTTAATAPTPPSHPPPSPTLSPSTKTTTKQNTPFPQTRTTITITIMNISVTPVPAQLPTQPTNSSTIPSALMSVRTHIHLVLTMKIQAIIALHSPVRHSCPRIAIRLGIEIRVRIGCSKGLKMGRIRRIRADTMRMDMAGKAARVIRSEMILR